MAAIASSESAGSAMTARQDSVSVSTPPIRVPDPDHADQGGDDAEHLGAISSGVASAGGGERDHLQRPGAGALDKPAADQHDEGATQR